MGHPSAPVTIRYLSPEAGLTVDISGGSITAPYNDSINASLNYAAFNNGQFTQANVSSVMWHGIPATSAADI